MYYVSISKTRKLQETIATTTSLFDAMVQLENYVWEYLTLKEGEERANDVLHQQPNRSHWGGWKRFSHGHIKTRNTKESLHRQTVWLKTKRPGWVYNSFYIEKIFEIDIIKINDHRSESEKLKKPALTLEDFEDTSDTDSEINVYNPLQNLIDCLQIPATDLSDHKKAFFPSIDLIKKTVPVLDPDIPISIQQS